MEKRKTKPGVFWHEVINPAEAEHPWHAYDEKGSSLCRDWALFGIGKPEDATTLLPRKSNRCALCFAGAITEEGESHG